MKDSTREGYVTRAVMTYNNVVLTYTHALEQDDVQTQREVVRTYPQVVKMTRYICNIFIGMGRLAEMMTDRIEEAARIEQSVMLSVIRGMPGPAQGAIPKVRV